MTRSISLSLNFYDNSRETDVGYPRPKWYLLGSKWKDIVIIMPGATACGIVASLQRLKEHDATSIVLHRFHPVHLWRFYSRGAKSIDSSCGSVEP